MTDEQAAPPTGDQEVELSSGQTTLTPAGSEPDTKPVVAVVSALGVLLTALCLLAIDRLDRSAPARYLAVSAVVAALVAVVVALGAQLSTLLGKPAEPDRRPGRRAVLLVLSAGALSLLAVLLAGTAALFVVQSRETVAASTEPTVVVQSGGSVAGGTNVTAQLSFPGLTAGTVVTATIASVSDDSSPNVLARSLVRVGGDGPGVVQLAAVVNPNDEAVIEAQAGDRNCKASLPRLPEGEATLTCTQR